MSRKKRRRSSQANTERRRNVLNALEGFIKYLEEVSPQIRIRLPQGLRGDELQKSEVEIAKISDWTKASKLTTRNLDYLLKCFVSHCESVPTENEKIRLLLEKANLALAYSLKMPTKIGMLDVDRQARMRAQKHFEPDSVKRVGDHPGDVKKTDTQDHQCSQEWLTELFVSHRTEVAFFLKRLCESDPDDGDGRPLEWHRVIHERPPRYKQVSHLPQELRQVLEGKGPNGFGIESYYSHQAESLDALRGGKHLLLVTQTASGKTWCYNPAIFESIIRRPGGKALYVFPLNALLEDQHGKIKKLIEGLDRCGIEASARLLHGGIDKSREVRNKLREDIRKENPDILCVNPELLSTVLVEMETARRDWTAFFKNLSYIVLDEVHTYRGLFGMHIAGLMRRLLIRCRRLGSHPQFILSSATVNNPLDLANRLTSLDPNSFTTIDPNADGSHQQAKHWVVVNTATIADSKPREAHLVAAAKLLCDLIGESDPIHGTVALNTIVFAKSFREMNRVFELAVRQLQKQRPELVKTVKKYASAELQTHEKREIFGGLQDGSILAVVATNALESGIDIPKLDACVIVGFPFTLMRLRQMAGRVGRQNEGIVVFVPNVTDVVDQFYRDSPDLLIDRPPESYVIDHRNPYIMRKHLNAAATIPGGIDSDEANLFGTQAIEAATKVHKIRSSQGNFVGTRVRYSEKDDYAIRDLRAVGQTLYVLCREANADCFELKCDRKCRSFVGTLDQQYVYRDCHPGAIYKDSNGVLNYVFDFDDERRIVRVRELPPDDSRRTFAAEALDIELLGEPVDRKDLPNGAQLFWGRVNIIRSFSGYYRYIVTHGRRCRRCSEEFGEEVTRCPYCRRRTREFTEHTNPEFTDFPKPFRDKVFSLTLDTIAAWLVVPVDQFSRKLEIESPCKLPDVNNEVRRFASSPWAPVSGASEEENRTLENYHRRASAKLNFTCQEHPDDTIVFPGVFGNCLRHWLSTHLSENRASEIFQQVTGYQFLKEKPHICSNCVSGTLLPAMHTFEHAVLKRYPEVAVGDPEDLASHTVLSHAKAGGPAIFWYDNFEGGIGAAEKLFDRFEDVLPNTLCALRDCKCGRSRGCPQCTYISRCNLRNDPLSRVAGLHITEFLCGQEVEPDFEPTILKGDHRKEKEKESKKNEKEFGESQPTSEKVKLSPNEVLRVISRVHIPILDRALSFRAKEIQNECPPITDRQLHEAYNALKEHAKDIHDWQLHSGMTPHQVFEILKTASPQMVKDIYKLVLARHFHPDLNPDKTDWATQMMQIVHDAYEKLTPRNGSRSRRDE